MAEESIQDQFSFWNHIFVLPFREESKTSTALILHSGEHSIAILQCNPVYAHSAPVKSLDLFHNMCLIYSTNLLITDLNNIVRLNKYAL